MSPLARALLLSVGATSALWLPAAVPRRCAPLRMDATQERIKDMIAENKIMLFMKGSKMFPQVSRKSAATPSSDGTWSFE